MTPLTCLSDQHYQIGRDLALHRLKLHAQTGRLLSARTPRPLNLCLTALKYEYYRFALEDGSHFLTWGRLPPLFPCRKVIGHSAFLWLCVASLRRRPRALLLSSKRAAHFRPLTISLRTIRMWIWVIGERVIKITQNSFNGSYYSWAIRVMWHVVI